MKFSEIANRLTGISTPLGGVSWQSSDLEVSAARRVIAFLEDRRVLYAPEEMEVAFHCVQSVLEIRHFLSGELRKLEAKSGDPGDAIVTVDVDHAFANDFVWADEGICVGTTARECVSCIAPEDFQQLDILLSGGLRHLELLSAAVHLQCLRAGRGITGRRRGRRRFERLGRKLELTNVVQG
jgi:hypothetical protein